MLISHWLKSLRNRLHPVQPRASRKSRSQRVATKNLTASVESLEDRLLLAGAGPQLISIFPNAGVTQPEDTGGILQQNEVLETAPRELLFRFNPGQTLDPTSLGDGIQVFRSGFDGVFLRDANGVAVDQAPDGTLTQGGTPFTGVAFDDSVQVPLGSLFIGEQPNEVILRFANKLPDDQYKIVLKGSAGNPLRNTTQLPFNNGEDLTFFFEVDLGAKIEAVVHQPVVRSQTMTVANTTSLTDGVTFTAKAGGKTLTFEFDADSTINSEGVLNDDVFAIDISAATTPTEFASAIRTALVSAATVHGDAFGLFVTSTGPAISIAPTATTTFSPQITRGAGLSATDLTITDGAIAQRENYINIYFNSNDPLNLTPTAENSTTVESPAFYQVISTNGTMRLPDSVTYNADAGVATLFFEDVLEDGTYNIRIGESFEATNNLATTVNLGTRFGNSRTTTINEFIGGDPTATALDEADVDLYRFVTPPLGGGTVTLSLSTTNGLNGLVRVFDNTGTEIHSFIALDGAGPTFLTTGALAGNSEFFIGISSQGNAAYSALDGSGAVAGGSTGSYRLTIDSNAADIPNDQIPANDDNSSFDTATNLGNLGTAGQVVSANIQPQTTLTLLPPEAGGNDEPGHRTIPVTGENHLSNVDGNFLFDALQDVGRGTDPYAPDQIPIIAYTFAEAYGTLGGVTQFNQITPEQIQRAREIFEIYSLLGGIQFIEVADAGEAAANGIGRTLHVVTGDPRVLGGPAPGPGGVLGIAGGNLAIMDNGENFSTQDNLYGQSWFQIAFHEIGHLLALRHSTELIAIMNGFSGLPGEAIFPTDNDITHIRRIYRRDSLDIDMYQFEVTEAGKVTIETLAERLAGEDASSLNSVLQLYKQELDGSRTLIAQNDDYFGNDSLIQLRLDEGVYFVGVSSVGNEDYDPTVSDSGAGGRSDGKYELRIELVPDLQPIPDAGTPVSPTDVSAKGRSVIYDTDDSLQFDGGARDATAFDGDADGREGGTFSFSFQVGQDFFVDKNAGNYANTGDPLGSITNPFTEIDLALIAARDQRNTFRAADDPTPVIVRIVGNSGMDGELGTLQDNVSYQIGFEDNNGPILVDGFRLQAPREVNVIIDAGAILKLQDANLEAGTSAQGLDRRGGSLQLLGTSFNDVILTSWHNDAIGGDTDGNGPAPRPGDWGGVVFREDSDYNFDYFETQAKVQIFAGPGPTVFDYVFTGFPIPATDATLTFTALGDFDAVNETLQIQFFDAGGTVIGTLPTYDLFNGGSPVPGEEDVSGQNATSVTARIRLTADQLAILATFGDEIRVRVTPSVVVDNIEITESLRIDLAVGTSVPIFLNTVNHATIQYAGGPVVVDSISQDFDSIHLFSARPTITYNTLELGAKAAISANPNSFNDTFEDPRRFSHDLDRLGPNIHDNNIFTHNTNGLKIRTVLPQGNAIENLSLPARFTATDIVHVITDNFQIDGSAGGLIVDQGSDPTITADDTIVQRSPGRLRIDPGVIVKLNDSRVEMERGGSNLIAEGTPEDPIIFTSINDDTFGAGGTFDTANDGKPFEDIGLLTLNVAWQAQGPAGAQNGQVENVAPNGEVVGAIHVVLAHPTNADRLWIGATNGGVWRTDNATSPTPTWIPLTDFNESLSIGAMSLDPNDPNRMLVGIGRFSSFGREGGSNPGLLLSENAGDSFTVINPPILQGQNISGVSVNGNVLLATANDFFGGGGLFRSTDNGGTWTLISGTNGLPTGSAFDLVSDPIVLDRHYVSIQSVGVFRSDDGGNSWVNISANDLTLDGFFAGAVDNNNTEMAVASTGRLYVAVLDQGQPTYIGYTDNLGSTWVQMDLPLTQESDGDIEGISPRVKPGGQGAIHFAIIVDPNDANIVYVGGDRQDGPFTNSLGADNFTGKLYRGDTTVTAIGQGLPFSPQWEHLTHSDSITAIPDGGTANSSAPHADAREFAFLANGDLIEVDDGGIFRRTSPGDNTGDWFSIGGNLQVAEIHDIAYDNNFNTILIGTQDNANQTQLPPGVFGTNPDQQPWQVLATGDGGDVLIDDTTSDTQSTRYISAQNLLDFRREVYDITDLVNPISVDFIDEFGLVVTDPQFVTPIALNAVNPLRLIIGGSGNVYESLDQGDTINQISANGVNEGPNIAYGGFRNGQPNPEILWIGSGNRVLLRSVPSGVLNATNYAGGEVRGIFLDPDDWMTAFVIDSDQIFMTTNGGNTFTDITGPTTFDGDLRSITYIEGTTTDALLVGGDNGVFAMDIATPGRWFNVGNNLPNAPAYDMEYDAVDDVLVVGTLGRGSFAITNAADLIISALQDNAPQPIGVSPQAGDWAGLIFNAGSSGNLDYVEVRYGGGLAPIEGGNAAFNPVEIIQADVRISNSEFEDNADGRDPAGTSDPNRIGRGANESATIFVRGAQPIIVSNIFENNEGHVISIDVNALKSVVQDDAGRATGEIYSRPFFGSDDPNRTTEFANNFGPLVRNNRMANNEFNGMEVRGGTLTTEVIWDDTDIVHIVRDEIIVPNLHTFGGLRLQSSGRESLVVKLSGQNAGFTAGGEELDIVDRIGGTIEIVGAPGRPVILTSLFDNSVGAGFDPDGIPLLDTVDPTIQQPQAGDWRSVRLDQFSNDRNVMVYNERERPTRLDSDRNNITANTPNAAEALGFLAPDLAPEPDLPGTLERAAADDNRKAGFEIHGFINTDDPTDQDVYSFRAEAGTEVWFDIDRTAGSLDTVLELIIADGTPGSLGTVIARSDNSQEELLNPALYDGIALPMRKDERLGGDFYTTNFKDAGMRVILPGAPDSTNTYFIRVRSHGASIDTVAEDQAGLADGETSGEYQLQIRTRQIDEHPGSTVTFSQIRFATNGIEVFGLPGHSPLVGEAGEAPEGAPGNNDTTGTATQLGNILVSDQNTFSVAGNLASSTDLDFYQFEVNYTNTQSAAGARAALVFDIDYADGLARPDTSLFVFSSTGALLLTATDSNIAEDLPKPLDADSLNDPSRGTAGALDAYIGSIELPQGTYFLAVTGGSSPQVLNQFTTANSAQNLLRLEPIESIFRVSADRIGTQSSGTVQADGSLTQLFDVTNENYNTSLGGDRPTSSIVPWFLGDIGLVVSRDVGTNTTELVSVNPFTGVVETSMGTFGKDVRDIDTNRRTDTTFAGTIIGFEVENVGNINDNNMGALITVDIEGNNSFTRQEDGIETYVPDPTDPTAAIRPNNGAGFGIQFNAISYNNGVASDTNADANHIAIGDGLLIYGVGQRRDELGDDTRNILYEFTSAGVAQSGPGIPNRPSPGQPLVAGAMTQIRERGILNTNLDSNPGAATAGTALIVTNAANNANFVIPDGLMFSIDDGSGPPSEFVFEMDSGPAGRFSANFAGTNDIVVRDGDFILLDPDGAGILPPERFEVDTGAGLQVTSGSEFVLTSGVNTFQIVDNIGNPVTFEFVRGGNTPTTAGAIPVDVTGASGIDGVNSIASRIVTAINNVGGTFQALATALNNGTGRISIVNDGALTVTVANGLNRTGEYLATAGTRVLVEEFTTSNNLARAFSDTVNGTLNPGFSNRLVNFPLYETLTTSFTNPGVFTIDATAIGGVTPPNVEVDYYVGQSDSEIAIIVAAAVNAQVGFNAAASGGVVTIGGGIFDAADPPFMIGGGAPGGIIRGTAVVNGELYAVSDAGGFYLVDSPQSPGGAELDYIDSSGALLGFEFQGLTAMPINVEGGIYNDLFIGIDSTGLLVAFDVNGVEQNVFLDGQSRMQIRRENGSLLTNIHGLTFSNLDENLWQRTTDSPGEGAPAGQNLAFTNPRDNAPFDAPRNAANNSYGFLVGGAHGTLETESFSLEGYSAEDQPVMYFTYFLETEQADGGPTENAVLDGRDIFRVYIADESGNWELLSSSNTAEPAGQARTFDNSGTWRQARLSLANYAGQDDLQLRFEFSTAASLDVGNILTGGIELRAQDGDTMRDGDSFVINAFRNQTDRNNGTQTALTFEFNMGYTLIFQPGSQVTNNDTFTIDSNLFTFVQSPNPTSGGNPFIIEYDIDDTAAQLALRFSQQLGAAGIGYNARLNGNRVNLENPAIDPLNPNLVTPSSAFVIEGDETIAGDFQIAIHSQMSDDQVANAMRLVIADNLLDTPLPIQFIKAYREVVKMIGHDVGGTFNANAITDAVGIGVTRSLPQNNPFDLDQDFGEFDDASRNRNNNFQGVYIDDIIIGFAERGEAASAAGNNSTFSAGGGVVGNYQLEIRRGTEYSIGDLPVTAATPFGLVSLEDNFILDTNDRLGNTISVTIPAGEDLFDGQTFFLSDGVRTLTFEFDDDDIAIGNPNEGVLPGRIEIGFRDDESAHVIAARLRDLLNSPQVTNQLDIAAALADGNVNFTNAAGFSSKVNIFGDIAANTSGDVSDAAFNGPGGNLNFESYANLANDYVYRGDSNQPRLQGEVQIAQNFIFDTLNVGILVDDNIRRTGDQPVIGTPRQLPQSNTAERLTRGVNLVNNVIATFGSAGIVLNGDDNSGTTGPNAAVPFHRVINNTIYGGVQAGGDGIRVSNNVAPTLLNNIIANTNTAINNATGGNSIVVERSTYQNNGANGINGVDGQFLLPGAPLFVDPTTNNFYLAAGAAAIDSARNQFEDRNGIVQVSASIGIPRSNLFAPEFDAFGQFRTNDEETANTGAGNPNFFDRGAIEREDISGPFATLIAPEDNDGLGADLDPQNTFVFLENAVIRQFIVGLDDIGIGIDDTSVNTDNVILTRNGQPLISGVDYLFRYNTNTKEITLLAASGVFSFGTYEIQLVNQNGIRDLAGNNLIPNRQPSGDTRFQITISPPPELVILPSTVIEGDAGDLPFMEFQVRLTGPTGNVVVADIATQNATTPNAATTVVDYLSPIQDLSGATITEVRFDPNNDPNLDGDNDPLTQRVRVQVIGDDIVEGNEIFFVNLTDAQNATIAAGSAQVTGTINDDDLFIRLISPTDPAVGPQVPQIEGDAGTTPMDFIVQLVDDVGNPVTGLPFDVDVDFTTVNNTATAGTDFVAQSGTLTISGTSGTATISVAIIGDEIQEPDLEDFFVQLSNPQGAQIEAGSNQRTGTIQDDDPKFSIQADAFTLEGDVGSREMIFTVEISSPVVSPVTVNVATTGGTATKGVDFSNDVLDRNRQVITQLTFDPALDPNLDGDNNPLTQQVIVDILGDRISEGDHAFTISIDTPTAGGVTPGAGTRTGTILDDDPRVVISDAQPVIEGNPGGTTVATFTVTLTDGNGNPIQANSNVEVDFETSIGTNVPLPPSGIIFETEPNNTLTSPEALNPQTFVLTANPAITDSQGVDTSTTLPHVTIAGRGDGTYDYFSFNGVAGRRVILDIDGATFDSQLFLYDSLGNLVVSSDDGFVNGGPTMDALDPDALGTSTEDAFLEIVLPTSGLYTFAVGRNTSINNPGTGLLPGTELQNGDQYTLHVSIEDFVATTDGQVTEMESNDSVATAQNIDNEGFSLDPDPNGFIDNQAGVDISTTIPHITITETGDDVTSSMDFFSFTVTSPGVGVFDIDGASFDTELTLFDAAGSVLAFNDDNGLDDGSTGPNGNFDSFIQFNFTQAGTYVIGVSQFDDGTSGPTQPAGATYTLHVSIENHAVGGAGTGTGGPAVADGTANPGTDFIANSGTLTIAQGSMTGTIQVEINEDFNNEFDENFFVRLTEARFVGGNGAVAIEDGVGEGTILNDDAPVITFNNPPPTNESGPQGQANTINFVVQLSRPADLVTTIDFTTVNGSAIGGQDFIPTSGTVTFQLGEQVKIIPVRLIRDGVRNEGTETFTVQLSNPIGADFGQSQATGTILDNTGIVENVFAVVAPDAGQPGIVKVLNSTTGTIRFEFEPYVGFTGGVRVATGDVNNDGTPDIITAPGPGGGPYIRVFSGVDGTPLTEFMAFDQNLRTGYFVATGDFAESGLAQGDSFDDIIVSQDQGGIGHIKAFSSATGPINNRQFTPQGFITQDPSRLLFNFVTAPGFTGGIRIAAGDVTGDGTDDLVASNGPGGGSHVQVFDGRTRSTSPSRFLFEVYPGFTGGVFIAVGNVDNSNPEAEIITGPGFGGGSYVIVHNAKTTSTRIVSQFFAYPQNFNGGVRLSTGDANGDSFVDILTAGGQTGGPLFRAFSVPQINSTPNSFFNPPQVASTIVNYVGGTGYFVAGVLDVDVAPPLRAAQVQASGNAPALTQQDVDTAVEEALNRLQQAGASQADIARLSSVEVNVGNLSGDLLGLATSTGILLDVDAAGNGWFIDPTMDQDEEFRSVAGSNNLEAVEAVAANRVDLLTVVLHEMGHKLGLGDLHSHLHPDALMNGTLGTGTRRLATSEELDEAFTDDGLFDSLLLD